jgi:hypothetical protein
VSFRVFRGLNKIAEVRINPQISNKIKNQLFGILNFGDCDLFGFCVLLFEIFLLLKPKAPKPCCQKNAPKCLTLSVYSRIIEQFFHPRFIGEYLLAGEAVEFVWENQPLIGFMDKIVRNNAGHIFFRLKPRRGDPDVVR